MEMNALENALCSSVWGAIEKYDEITGNWLFHAPEHYLQNFILISLGKSLTQKVISERGV